MKKTNRRISYSYIFICIITSLMLVQITQAFNTNLRAEDIQEDQKDKEINNEVGHSTKELQPYKLTSVTKEDEAIDLEFEYINDKDNWITILENILSENNSTFSNLRNLVVNGGEIKAYGSIETLFSNCPNLEILDLKKTKYPGYWIFSLVGLPNLASQNQKLRILKFPKGANVLHAPLDDSRKGLLTHHPSLTYLDVSGITELTRNSLKHLEKTTKIVLPKRHLYILWESALRDSTGVSYPSNHNNQAEISLYNLSKIYGSALNSDNLKIHENVNLVRFGGSQTPEVKSGSFASVGGGGKVTILHPKKWDNFIGTLQGSGFNAVPPKSSTNGTEQTLGSKWEVSFEEKLFNGFYPVKLLIYKDGTQIPYTPNTGEENKFIIDSLKEEDFGTYTFDIEYEVHPDETDHIEEMGKLMEVATGGKYTLKKATLEIDTLKKFLKVDTELSLIILTNITGDMNLDWSSSNESIASVDATGVVTAKKKGDVIITVKDTISNLSATKTLEVVDNFLLKDIPDSINLEDTINITSKNDYQENWEWDESYFEAVETQGLTLKAIKAGSGKIRHKDSTNTKVSKKVTIRSLKIDKHEPTLHVDETMPLVLLKSHDDFAQLEWTSEDDTIAKVDEHGVVRGATLGTTKITVKDKVYHTTTSTTIQITKPLVPINSPKAVVAVASNTIKTGDNTNTIALISALLFSSIVICYLYGKYRKSL